MTVCVVDYGAGNLRSVQKALEHLGAHAVVSGRAADIERADKVILPGVGAFGNAEASLDNLGLRAPILEYIAAGKPFLGICLGLQLLFESSDENPGFPVFLCSNRRFVTPAYAETTKIRL